MDRNLQLRKESFKGKSIFKEDELRRRRGEAQVELRKQKREEAMAKKRNINLNNTVLQSTISDSEDSEPDIIKNTLVNLLKLNLLLLFISLMK